MTRSPGAGWRRTRTWRRLGAWLSACTMAAAGLAALSATSATSASAASAASAYAVNAASEAYAAHAATAAGPGACVSGQTALAQVTAGGAAGSVAGSVPVVFVHGIVSSPAMWKPDISGSLSWQAATMRGITAWTFNYAHHAEDWVTNSAIGPALAAAIGCLARASGHKVIIVAHSMGGLAAQYAIGTQGSPAAGHVAEVVTIGTPYTGSPLLSDFQALLGKSVDTAVLTGDPGEAAVAEGLLSVCAGIATHTDDNPCSLVSVVDAPVGTALETNSLQIRALPPWPSSLPVLDVAGNMDLFVGAGPLGVHAHPGDIAVTLPSATAHDTVGSPFVVACSSSLVRVVEKRGLPSCFHSNLVNDPVVINRILTEIRKYQPSAVGAASPSSPSSSTPDTASLTGFDPAADLSKVWDGTLWDGTPYRDALAITSIRLVGSELTLSYTAQHSGASSALSEETGDACIEVDNDDFAEAPTAATPGLDAGPLNGNGSYSGTLTFPILSPGRYVLSWGCFGLDTINSQENITLGTATGTEVGPPQVDHLYQSWTWYVTGVRYTGSSTTVDVTTIGDTTIFDSPQPWALDPPDKFTPGDAYGVAYQANSVVTSLRQLNISSMGMGGYMTDQVVTFPTGQHGLYFVFKDTLNDDEYIRLP